jgi:predicted MPP superfamily phosphohydrolase
MRQARRIGGVPVIMIHAPPWPGLVPQSVPLVLAGHTHCGQIVFPGWDNSFDLLHWAPRYDPRFRCGVTHVSHYTAIVTGGVGAATMTPLRINAPPDFWIITITGPR